MLFEVNEETGKRIAEVRKKIGLSRAEFGDLLGFPSSRVVDIERGKQKAPWDFLNAMLEKIQDLNGAWLLRGEGLAWTVRDGTPEGERHKALIDAALSGKASPGLIRVPLYEVHAAAGGGAITADYPEQLKVFDFPEWWLRGVVRVTPRAVQVLIAWGDSMKPDVMPGDLLIIDTSHTSVQADCLYVFEMDGGVFIKKLQRLPGGKLKVISANPDYEAYTVTPNNDPSFKVVGRVAFYGKVT